MAEFIISREARYQIACDIMVHWAKNPGQGHTWPGGMQDAAFIALTGDSSLLTQAIREAWSSPKSSPPCVNDFPFIKNLVDIIESLISDVPCHLDDEGVCQEKTHQGSATCPHHRARLLLESLPQ